MPWVDASTRAGGDALASAIADELLERMGAGDELELQVGPSLYVFVCSEREGAREVGAFVLEREAADMGAEPDAMGFVWPSEIENYLQMWTPYVEGTVTALKACAAATTDATVAKQTSTNAYFLESLWHAYDGYDGFDLMNSASGILTNLQQALYAAGLFTSQATSNCPAVTFPQPVPLPEQGAVISALQNAGYVVVGTLELLVAGAGGVLEAAGTVAKKAASAASGLAGFLATPWLWLAIIAAAGAYIVHATGVRAPASMRRPERAPA